MPSADVSVRPAIPDDADAIAGIQLACWEDAFGPEFTATLPADDIRESWAQSITSPPTRRHRVLTACAGPRVVGFAAVTPEGDVLSLEVAPGERRQGHGSRLLAAAVDTLRDGGVGSVRCWALEGDDARAAFYAGAGLAPGGVRRTLQRPDGGRAGTGTTEPGTTGQDGVTQVVEVLWRAEL